MPGHDGHDHDGHDDDDKKPGKPGSSGSTTLATTTDQLNAAARNIATLSSQVDAIDRTWIDPPNPDVPTCINDCNQLISYAAHITTLANTYLTRLRGG
jgi:hypothetical protein